MTAFIVKNKFAALFLIVVLGFCLRLRGLDRAGFNEDEAQKVLAAESYRQGNFSVNLEHPMLLKWLVVSTMATADVWNRGLGRSQPISDEFAIRLPNVVFGSLTAVVIFLFTEKFFGWGVGLLSAFLWSTGTIAIIVNRVAKEDTLLVFFTWLAYYFYLRAKKQSTVDVRLAEKSYVASGVSFGLMLASKYFPHYFGLNALYYYLRGEKHHYPPLGRRATLLFYGSIALVFVIANPMILLPNTWQYMLLYVREGTMTHRGYLMSGRFYFDDPAHLRGGMPIYFYALLLAVKTPVTVLITLVVGLFEVFRRRNEAGPFFLLLMFVLWLVPFSLLSAKWLRYMLSWLPSVYIIAAVGLAKILSRCSTLLGQLTTRRLGIAVAATIAAAFVLQPLYATAKAGPHYSLYLNSLAHNRPGHYFPHDELDDAGLREAIWKVCAEAPLGATVGGEAPPVFAYYLRKCGRQDLRYVELSHPGKRAEALQCAIVVIQDERKYFENLSLIRRLESEETPLHIIEIEGVPAAKIYYTEELAGARAPGAATQAE